MKRTLTVFTPTYNRAHTINRTYESLCRQTCKDFEWMVIDDGSTDNTCELIQQYIDENIIPIHYIYKENGGLHTGYNTAYANIETELNVCIDSDDFMPNNAVELIINTWKERGSNQYAGIIGLDYYADTKEPISGKFPEGMTECYQLDLITKKIHTGDAKQVMRTELMKKVAPQVGFAGEKNFNPFYMIVKVCDDYPLLVLNENLCFVEYQQTDSMSAGIFKQYMNSPRSFAKMRIQTMTLKRSPFTYKLRANIHYVSSCIIARDKDWLKNSPCKIMTLCMAPLGWLLSIYIKQKAR